MKNLYEGVIKFSLKFQKNDFILEDTDINAINESRTRLVEAKLIGVYPADHHWTPNVGYGNISCRYTKNPKFLNQFIVSGSQTGHLKILDRTYYCLVTSSDIDNNVVEAIGPVYPSSESMTHAAVYEIFPDIQYVIHVHHELMWNHWNAITSLATPVNVAYGTPAMAEEIKKLALNDPNHVKEQIIAMLGHKDGLIIFGSDCVNLVDILLQALAKVSKYS